MIRTNARPDPALQQAILDLLRGAAPSHEEPLPHLEACLARYECGGALHRAWSGAGRLASLPAVWREALARAHHKTVVDNLVALAQFREVGAHMIEERIPFILLKGAAYLGELYDDPGARHLTDIDLLVRRKDAGRIARRLARAGYEGSVGCQYPEDRRFEMWRPGPAPCHFEIHWSPGLPFRFRVDPEGIWERAVTGALEGIPCRRMAHEDALLYHVAHQADSYYGPSLKWALDLREMLRRWQPDPGILEARAQAWRVRTAVHLALCHLEKLLPGETPGGLRGRFRPGVLRSWLLEAWLDRGPLELFQADGHGPPRYPLRGLLLDRPTDALALTARVLARPLERPLRRAFGGSLPPWRWAD